MAQQVVCRGTSMAPSARLSSANTSSMRVSAGHRLTPVFRAAVTPRSFTVAARRSAVKVAAVMDVDESTFDAEVLKVIAITIKIMSRLHP